MTDEFRLGPHTVRVLAEQPDYGFAEGRFEPGVPGPASHSHAWDEGFYVVAGQVEVVVDGDERVLGPGGFALAPAGSVHTFSVHGSVPATFFATSSSAAGIPYLREMAELLAGGPPNPQLLAPLHQKFGVVVAPSAAPNG